MRIIAALAVLSIALPLSGCDDTPVQDSPAMVALLGSCQKGNTTACAQYEQLRQSRSAQIMSAYSGLGTQPAPLILAPVRACNPWLELCM